MFKVNNKDTWETSNYVSKNILKMFKVNNNYFRKTSKSSIWEYLLSTLKKSKIWLMHLHYWFCTSFVNQQIKLRVQEVSNNLPQFPCIHMIHLRSSHQRCSVKEGVLRNFANFTGKHLCQSLFFLIKLQAPPAILFKKRCRQQPY